MKKRRTRKRSIKNIILINGAKLAVYAAPISFLAIFLTRHPVAAFVVLTLSLVYLALFSSANKGVDLCA